MPKLGKIALVLFAVLAVSYALWTFIRGGEVPNDPRLPPYVKTYAYGMGMLRIRDVESDANLFSYHEDGLVKPVRIERTGQGQWTVVFEERKR